MNIGILGATGCVGELLLTYLLQHPNVKKLYAASRSCAHAPLSKKISQTYHSLEEITNLCESDEIHVLFSSLPCGTSAEAIRAIALKNKNTVIIDLSADFRYRDAALYKRIYEKEHASADLLKYAVYGLSEWNRSQIQKARIIACPGCHPTSVLLPLLPVLRHVKPTGIISIVSSSGISSARGECKSHVLCTEHTENIVPYAVGEQHPHVSEMVYHLARLAHLDEYEENLSSPLVFTPQRVPLTRGLLSVITVPLAPQDVSRAAAALVAQYAGEAWVTVYEENTMPETAHVRGTNYACIGYRCESSSLILYCAIDDGGKGAAGQAVQNFNIRYGFLETLGLPTSPA